MGGEYVSFLLWQYPVDTAWLGLLNGTVEMSWQLNWTKLRSGVCDIGAEERTMTEDLFGKNK